MVLLKVQCFSISLPSHFGGFRNPGSHNLRSLTTKKKKSFPKYATLYCMIARNLHTPTQITGITGRLS